MLETKYEKCFYRIRGFLPVSENHLSQYEKQKDVILPLKGSRYSAGYDFFIPFDAKIEPNGSLFFWTDVKAYMQEGEWLGLYPRSSIAIKKDIIVKNITGIIDYDYFENPKNDGNIGICLKNIGNDIQYLEKGERVAQGIFQLFYESDNCNSENERKGGIGSTNAR